MYYDFIFVFFVKLKNVKALHIYVFNKKNTNILLTQTVSEYENTNLDR
jgi:hypothetical protein